MEQKWHEGYKIVVLGEADVMECEGLMFPTTDEQHLDFFKHHSFTPQGIPVKYYHPLIDSVPDNIVANMDLYTVNLKDALRDKLFLLMLSNSQLSDASMTALVHGVETMADNMSFPFLPTLIRESSEKQTTIERGFGKTAIPFQVDARRSVPATSRVLLRLKDLGLFASADFALNIDKNLSKIMKDDSITVFSTKWLEESEIACSLNYYLLQLVINNVHPDKKTLIIVDDAWRLFPSKRNQETEAQSRLAMNMVKLIKWVRKRGAYIIAVAQKPDDIYDRILNEMSVKICFQMDLDKAELKAQLPSAEAIDLEIIPKLKKRHWIVLGYDKVRNPFRGFQCYVRETQHVTAANQQELLSKIGFKDAISEKLLLASNWQRTTDMISG